MDTLRRKVRIDKKKDVKPTISTSLKSCIYRLSYITNTPVKCVAEILCEKGLKSHKVIEYLSQYFRRDYQFNNTLFMGDLERESQQGISSSEKTERITIRFSRNTYEDISELAYALSVTTSKATALLLDASIRNTNILNAFVKLYLHDHINDNRMNELKAVLKFINSNNPYREEISWFALLNMIYEDLKDSTNNIRVIVGNWIDKYKNR